MTNPNDPRGVAPDIFPAVCVYCGANPCDGSAPECEPAASAAPAGDVLDAPANVRLYGVVIVSDGGAWMSPDIFGPFTSAEAARRFIAAEYPDMEPEPGEPAPMEYTAGPFDTALVVPITAPRTLDGE